MEKTCSRTFSGDSRRRGGYPRLGGGVTAQWQLRNLGKYRCVSKTVAHPWANGKILVVDDDAPTRLFVTRVLELAGYESATAGDADAAREVLLSERFDLLVTDMNMPGGSGLELIADVLENHRDTAAIMVTGEDNADLADEALRLGAYGYVIKPVSANEVLISVNNALTRRALELENRDHRECLEEKVKERTAAIWNMVQELELAQKELRTSRAQTVERLAIAAEFRDDETARHIHRMSRYCTLLASRLGESADRCELIRVASVMHDVGKIGVPDTILLKPGKLTTEEFEIMKQHTVMGYRILTGTDSDLLELAATIALTHHEKFDGSGYPQGSASDVIPLEGRIAAVADVFDALTTNRVYRCAFPFGEAVEMMKGERGRHFDPELLDPFLDALDEAQVIMDEEDGAA